MKMRYPQMTQIEHRWRAVFLGVAATRSSVALARSRRCADAPHCCYAAPHCGDTAPHLRRYRAALRRSGAAMRHPSRRAVDLFNGPEPRQRREECLRHILLAHFADRRS